MPARTSFTFSPLLLQRRYDIWGEDAAEFRPERWLERANDKQHRAAATSVPIRPNAPRLSSESSADGSRASTDSSGFPDSDSEPEKERKRPTAWNDSYSFVSFHAGPRVVRFLSLFLHSLVFLKRKFTNVSLPCSASAVNSHTLKSHSSSSSSSCISSHSNSPCHQEPSLRRRNG